MDCSTPGLPVHHQLPELAQTHVYWVGDAIQPSHPLSSPSPPAFSLSQDEGLFQWVSSLHQVAFPLEGLRHMTPPNMGEALRIMWAAPWSIAYSGHPHLRVPGSVSNPTSPPSRGFTSTIHRYHRWTCCQIAIANVTHTSQACVVTPIISSLQHFPDCCVPGRPLKIIH